MNREETIITAIYTGWHDFQEQLIQTIAPLSETELALRAAEHLRTVDELARHMIGARARWFSMLFGEGGEAFKDLGGWDRAGAQRGRPVERPGNNMDWHARGNRPLDAGAVG